ncbi:hypothetical protein M9H77_30426 [Catharanthus roseus]|uniref:Uncharacterized protein n=1 Tax=Catharanthus roseus TaxID=4058 RepID=A0ACB9ZY25_CATRO|nr:hypothetical protein M9H77_30426 [Catharanthus roseus]
MAPVTPGIGLGTSLEEDPIAASPTPIPPMESVSSFPALPSLIWGGVREYDICGYCLWREQRAEVASQQVVALREKISRMDALFYAACQARRQETARAAMQFIAQFLGTTRDSVDRARDELESRPGCSSS